jgi:hypothetical protein
MVRYSARVRGADGVLAAEAVVAVAVGTVALAAVVAVLGAVATPVPDDSVALLATVVAVAEAPIAARVADTVVVLRAGVDASGWEPVQPPASNAATRRTAHAARMRKDRSIEDIKILLNLGPDSEADGQPSDSVNLTESPDLPRRNGIQQCERETCRIDTAQRLTLGRVEHQCVSHHPMRLSDSQPLYYRLSHAMQP